MAIETPPLRYSADDLKEFEAIISEKLDSAKKDIQAIKETLSRRNEMGIDSTTGSVKVMEDGSETAEKETLTQMAARLQKFIQQNEAALVRIKNGTYGVCIDTGKLIPKERLKLVPHTQHTVEAKLKRA